MVLINGQMIFFLFIDIDECAPAPCQNAATCVDLVGNYRCDCVNGYSGSNCETSKSKLQV